MEEFGRLEGSEQTIAILGGRWWPQAAKQEGDKISKQFHVLYGKSVKSAKMLEVSLLGVGMNGAPSRKGKGCVVNAMVKSLSKAK